MQSKRRPSYHEYDSAPPPVSGPHVALTQMYNAPGAVYVNSTLKSNAGHGGHPSSSMQHAPMAPPMGAPARRTTDTAASYGQGTGYASVQYAPPPVRQSQPMYPPPPPLDISGPIGPHGAATRAAAVNYDSDVSSMATPVATPDASFRYRTSAFSPNEASESPPPAPISYLGSSGRDSAHDRVPTLLRPQSFLALPIMGGEMDLAPNSGSMRLPPSTGYAPPQAYGPPPLMNGPPARVRATSGSSIAPNGRMEMPPPPIGPGMSSNHSNIGQYSQANAAAAMQNVYSRSIQQQQYADPGSPGSRGKGSGHGAPNYIGGYPNNNMPVVGPPAGVPGSPTGKSLNNNRNRIDPSQLPRPPPPPKDFVYHTRAGLGRKVPPVSNAVFQCVDTGNCSPRFLRVTTGAPSTTSALAYKLGVPLALVATPFAHPENGEDPIAIVEMVPDGTLQTPQGLQCNPIRCARCKGYMNPFVKWLNDGQKWACNLCHMINDTPPWYFCSLDGSGLRVDRDARPELSRGSVDFAVNSDYCVRPPQESIFIFCIDVSERAVSCGLTTATIQVVAKVLQELYDMVTPARVGIISFSKMIQFYSIRTDREEPFSIFSINSKDAFCPLPAKLWIRTIHDNIDMLKSLLWRLPELHPNVLERDGSFGGYSSSLEGSDFAVPPVSCPLAALIAVADGLKDVGGKIFLFSPNHSVSGTGTLANNREYMSGSIYGTPAELGLYGSLEAAAALMKNSSATSSYSGAAKGGGFDGVSGATLITGDVSPSAILFGADASQLSKDTSPMGCFPEKTQADDKETLEGYLLFADWCGRHNISTDVYMTTDGNRHKDISLFAEIARRTGGSLHPISNSLLRENAVFMLQQELSHGILSLAASETVLKLRCSAGFRADDYIGQGRMSETATEAEIAWLNSDFTFVYTFVHESNMKEDDALYLQLAILYTSVPGGRRLVRVHNMQLSCTANPSQVFRNCDLDCVATALFKIAVDKALKLPLTLERSGPREFLAKCVFDILYGYRTNCSTESPKSQLILPESLKVLPLYVMCMLKHPALLENIGLNNSSSRGGGSCRPHISGCERCYELSRMQALPVRETILTLYPRLFALHQLRTDDGVSVDIGTEQVQLPRSLPCSSEILDSGGFYLLDDGADLWLYVGRNMPADELDELFDPNPAILAPDRRPLTEISFRTDALTDYSLPHRINNIITALQRNRINVPGLKIIWADAPHSLFLHRFSLRLVEDSLYGTMSYVDYLVKTHAKIQAKL